MKYHVSIKEVNIGGVTVDARTPEEAAEKAEVEYYNGNVYWKDCDMQTLSVRREADRGDAR